MCFCSFCRMGEATAHIRKMENGNDARIVRRQTYNETGFVETNLMGLLCVTHPTWNVMRFVLPACWGLLIDGFALPACAVHADRFDNHILALIFFNDV